MMPFDHRLRVLQWQLFPHEPETRYLQRKLARDSLETFVDIGANFGMYAHLMRPKAKKVVAFEPGPARFAHLQAVYGDSVTLENVAVGAVDGQAVLRMPMRGSCAVDDLATLSTDNDFATSHIDAIDEVAVRTATLDGYFDATQRVDLIKIDVEGHEFSVIQGGLKLLRRDRPGLLIETELRHSPFVGDLFECLEAEGYHAAHLVRGRGLVPLHFNEVADLQSPERYAIRARRPLSRVYVNNIFFLHPQGRVTQALRPQL